MFRIEYRSKETRPYFDLNGGFTLVEILVVIAVIAIITAILLPVFAHIRERARQTSCSSNLEQLSHAFAMYQQDNDGDFPFWNFNLSANSGSQSPNHLESLWFNAIYPYVKSAPVFRCPDATDTRTLRQTNVDGWVDSDKFDTAGIVDVLKDSTISYGMSEMLSDGEACKSTVPCREGGLDRPSESLLVADCAQPLTNDLGNRPSRNDPTDPRHAFIITRVAFPNAPTDCFTDPTNCGAARAGSLDSFGDKLSVYQSQTRHNVGSNICFADGHVKWWRADSITYDLFAGDNNP